MRERERERKKERGPTLECVYGVTTASSLCLFIKNTFRRRRKNNKIKRGGEEGRSEGGREGGRERREDCFNSDSKDTTA